MWNMHSGSLPLEITEVCFSAVLSCVLISLTCIKYRITENGVTLKVLGIDLLGDNLQINTIAKVVVCMKKKVYVCYTNKSSLPQITLICIGTGNIESFCAELTKRNPYIEFSESDTELQRDSY